MQSAGQYFEIWRWRAQCMAEEGVATCKDFEHGLPALQHAGDARVALGRIDTEVGTRLVFLAADLASCVAVL